MWMAALLVVALGLGLAVRLPERTARLAIIIVALLLVAFQTQQSGMI